ncbi:conserved hypothetical protein [Histoplasma capsulatum var. duboisii H88]|uniref:EDC4-like protein pdc1 beta-propeller domain-containing protein n=2 Tax=Ajellomyces capsulatus (strain H88) TaxID=544711 RepID=F0UMA2_AJEC8|nr:conserved hypothetical protein [Histoplasma capsulatum var. duboisii H88]
MSTPADLQALFANIKPRPSPNNASNLPSSEAQSHRHNGSSPGEFPFPSSTGLFQATVSSPLYSPQYTGTPPHHASDVISPNVQTPRNNTQSPQQQSLNADRTANLLSLLKFSPASQNVSAPKQSLAETVATEQPQGDAPVGTTQGGHGRGISASDIVASFMGKPTTSTSAATGLMSSGLAAAQPSDRPVTTSPPADNAQDMLLKLLNLPKPQILQSEQSVTAVAGTRSSEASATSRERSADAGPKFPEERRASPMRLFGSGESRETTPFEPPIHSQPKDSIFTYVNPFEQLAAASPRNRTPQGSRSRALPGASPAPDIANAKKNGVPALIQVNGQRKRPEPSRDIPVSSSPLETDENAAITPGPDASEVSMGPDQKKVKIKKETVPEALGEVAGQVDKEVEDALARAAAEEVAHIKEEVEEESSKAVLKALAEKFEQTALDAQEEPEKDISIEVTPKSSPPAASNLKESADDTNGAVVDSWESETGRVIPVYNFPLKPFMSITWKGNTENIFSLRSDGIMDIARLKKDFDQLDRSLTSATSDYIVYALAKNGGMRIVRQDDGQDRQVFRSTNDRVFNVSLSTTAPGSSTAKEQVVMGIGVSGAVYWATISKADNNLFEKDALERDSLIFPPFPSSDENTSGGQLKTRARRSSRHPEFFAIGRGKFIHIVWPHFAISPKYGVTKTHREVDTEKFFKEKSVKIATGKAGKDFIFSDDDTVIVSLDKTGRMRFWDIRDVADFPHANTSKLPADIRVPLLTLVTGSPTEKSWPTSVLFIDKLRPYTKASALRYVLVGLKQNHTLQLWDIGLGKAVQELKFPHDNESDAICSVAYHPGSGIIVVGHPTRNSIYFVHLSAPRYSLPLMSQATYIQRVAEKDERLPKPESTACMSGIRELSFGSKGQLRSLELLPLTRPSVSHRGMDEEAGLFELYVMHSLGVTCLNIRKSDLGWSSDNKIIDPVDALKEGFIEVNALQSFPPQVDEQSTNGDVAPKGVPKGKEPAKKATGPGQESVVGVESSRNQSPSKQPPKKKTGDSVSTSDQHDQAAASTDKSEKRKKKKADNGKPKEISNKEADQSQLEIPQSVLATETHGSFATGASIDNGPAEAINIGVSSDFLNKEVKKIEKAVSTEFTKCLNRELDALYVRFDQDRRSQEQAATAKQDAVLRLVSSTLSDNVEKNLSRIIANNVQSMVVPALIESTAKSMDQKIKEGLSQQLDLIAPPVIREILPVAVQRAMSNENMHLRISELISASLSNRVERDISKVLHEKIVPSFKDESIQQARIITKEVERQFVGQMKQYELRQQNDSAKIDQLTMLVRSLSETVSTMAAAQSQFQKEILNLSRQLGVKAELPETSSATNPVRGVPPPEPSPEEAELQEISELLNTGRYEEGSIRWIQSSQQADLFSNLFVKLDPSFLSNLSPLVVLSVSAAVTSSFETNVMDRLNWLERVFQAVKVRDPEIYEVAPKIMTVLIQRLEALYMAIAENTPHDPVLRRIPRLTRWARDLQEYNQ